MNIYIIQFINYTLSFFMWMIAGRVVLTLMIGNRENFALGLFTRVTEPVFRVTRKLLPFAKESCIPYISFVLILIMRLALIITTGPTGAHK